MRVLRASKVRTAEQQRHVNNYDAEASTMRLIVAMSKLINNMIFAVNKVPNRLVSVFAAQTIYCELGFRRSEWARLFVCERIVILLSTHRMVKLNGDI